MGADSAELRCYDYAAMAEGRISIEQVQHVARLARLELAPDEEIRMQSDLSAILSYVDKLNTLDTDKIEPTAQVGEAGTPMRRDEVTNLPDPERMIANAPARRDHFICVPKIIE
jgi:aspartyl-tRNA(Asn)/glutamyl-tRNA(Gln) amidotransferase subunit C